MGYGFINKDAVIQVKYHEVTCDVCGYKETCTHKVDTPEAYLWDQDIKNRWTHVVFEDGPEVDYRVKAVCNKCLTKTRQFFGKKP